MATSPFSPTPQPATNGAPPAQTQQDVAAAEKAKQDAQAAYIKTPQGFIDASRDLPQQVKDSYARDAGVMPGSADVGGSKGAGEFERQQALAHQADNNDAQVSNDAAMDASLANMRGAGNRTNPENATLLGREAASRNQQLNSVNLDRQAAEGNAPSAAAFASRQSGNDLMAARASALGGAHNAAGLAGAQVGQAQTGGMNASNIAATGGMARSKEIGDAIGMYGTQSGAVRQGDLQRLSTSNQNSQATADMNDKFAIGSGELAAKQGALGNAYQSTDAGWYGQSMDPAERQFQYDQEMQAKLAGQDSAQAAAAIAESRAQAAQQRQIVNGGVAGGLGLIGTIAGGPAGGAAAATAGGMMMSQINGGPNA